MAKNRIVIEIEDLVNIVRAKTCLWDQNDPNYFKRDYQRVAWMEVSDELQAPVTELKKRWRGLRDTFTRELRKVDLPKDDEELAQSSTWRHFYLLLFLKDVVSTPRKPRKRRNNPKVKELGALETGDDTNVSISDSSSTHEIGIEHDEDPLTSIMVQSYEQEDTLITSDVTHEPITSDVANGVTSCWTDDWKENMMDADAQFLMSLLPFMQDVPKKRKLLVRAKLTQVLLDEQNIQKYH